MSLVVTELARSVTEEFPRRPASSGVWLPGLPRLLLGGGGRDTVRPDPEGGANGALGESCF